MQPKQTYWNSKLILVYNWSRLSRMRRGEWSLLLLRLLSVNERMKGHSDMIKLLFALSIFFFLNSACINLGVGFPRRTGIILFLKKLQSWICLWRTRLRVNRTCQSIDMFEILLQKVGFSYLEIEIFWKITHATTFQTLCGFTSLTTRPISADKRLKNDKNINWTSLYLRHEKCNPKSCFLSGPHVVAK